MSDQLQAYAQSFDDHVAFMVQSVLSDNNEMVTHSHFAWLHRMYSRVLVRTLELDRREADIERRERAFQRNAKKSTRSRNTNGSTTAAGGDEATSESPA